LPAPIGGIERSSRNGCIVTYGIELAVYQPGSWYNMTMINVSISGIEGRRLLAEKQSQ
jgi:hypothetical protein